MTYFTIIFAFLIAIACFWASIKLIRTYLKVKSWKRAEGRVLSKKVEIRKKRSNSGTAIYIPVLRYSYEFNGKSFEGSKVYLEELVGGARSAREHQVEAKLKTIGDTQTVFVNPANPDESVMFCDGAGVYIFMMLMGTVSFLVGFGYLLTLL
jgi:hypothetical protein